MTLVSATQNRNKTFQKSIMDDKLKLFLSLGSFDEYMEKYDLLCGLKMGKDTFAKEMCLMETDSAYTHRKKDSIRQARKKS